MNIPEMAYRDALGFKVEEVADYSLGVRAVHFRLDLRARLTEILAGRLSVSGLHQVMTRQFYPVFCPGGSWYPSPRPGPEWFKKGKNRN